MFRLRSAEPAVRTRFPLSDVQHRCCKLPRPRRLCEYFGRVVEALLAYTSDEPLKKRRRGCGSKKATSIHGNSFEAATNAARGDNDRSVSFAVHCFDPQTPVNRSTAYDISVGISLDNLVDGHSSLRVPGVGRSEPQFDTLGRGYARPQPPYAIIEL